MFSFQFSCFYLVLFRCSGIWCCPPCRNCVWDSEPCAFCSQGSADSANSGKGERPISLPPAVPKPLMFSFVFRVLVTGGLFVHAEGRGSLSRVRAFNPTCPEPGLSCFKAPPNGFLAPPPGGPFSWPWRLCLGRGSGGAPFCFAAFPPFFLPSA